MKNEGTNKGGTKKEESTASKTASLVERAFDVGTRRVYRVTKTPFASRSERPVIVHCTHHKAGTVWFNQVLRSLTGPYGLRYQRVRKRPIDPRSDIVFCEMPEKFRREQLGTRPLRGSHIVRDPRDMVISGYEYHKRTREPWALQPDPRFGGRSYQEYLSAIDEHEGLLAEIDWMARGTVPAMSQWDYEQPEFLELHYEDAIDDEQGTFDRLFRWYGFNDTAVSLGMEAVERFSLKKGGAGRNHVRSGQPGEWRSRFAPEHVAFFKDLTGDLLIRLGYEADQDWQTDLAAP